MVDFEQLGMFYLGRETSRGNDTAEARLVLYDSKDLLTHAVCVGMTGSGKTGLCVGLLEEAALDGIPAIVIDPKGDLSNLLLTFPNLSAEEFLPWINEEDARSKQLTPRQYAEQQSQLWAEGLAEWGQGADRIKRLKAATEFVIYTPGSSAGVPISVMKSFDPPAKPVLDDPDLLGERISSTVGSLLDLLDIDPDPVQSREHILLSTLLQQAWLQGRSVEVGQLIEMVQRPPISRIGVFDMDSFFPEKERFALAMKLNNLLAASTMQAWIEGEPLDMDRMLYSSSGRPRIAIYSIAHLGDKERMFFVSLLLLEVLGWMRGQSGTGSLRAILYMDELFGYLPPVSNPPSKGPLLALLKQARAFGLGLVLATQNPVDLDYKALSNAGTWFIGRLQTERDQERILDGLEGVAGSTGSPINRSDLRKIITGLGKRVFLMKNVHEDQQVIFQTRWVMSYLRGPLTRDQIKSLMEPTKSALPASPAGTSERITMAPGKASAEAGSRPVLAPSVVQLFVPCRTQPGEASILLYEPMCLAIGKVYYLNAKAGVTTERRIGVLIDVNTDVLQPSWEQAMVIDIEESELDAAPDGDALFGDIPPALRDAKNYVQWSRTFRDWLYRSQSIELMKSPSLGIVSNPQEQERDFRIRLQQLGHERRDQLLESIRRRYATKLSAMQERIRRAAQALDREKEQAKQQKLQTVISAGVTLLDAFVGRKTVKRSTLGRATTTARGAGRILKEGQDVKRAEENLEALERQLSELQSALESESAAVIEAADPLLEELQTVIVKPKKTDIAVRVLGLGWVPYWRDTRGGLTPAF